VAELGPAWQNNPYLDTLVFVQRLRRRHDGFWPDSEKAPSKAGAISR